MRTILLSLAALIALASSAPAFAANLNPQPLPPGMHAAEPPDPCLKYHSRRARARCHAHASPDIGDGSVHFHKRPPTPGSAGPSTTPK